MGTSQRLSIHCFVMRLQLIDIHVLGYRDPPSGVEKHIPVLFLDLNGNSIFLTSNLESCVCFL